MASMLDLPADCPAAVIVCIENESLPGSSQECHLENLWDYFVTAILGY